MDVELLVSNDTILGEGPVWDHRNRILYWVDITRGHLQAYDYLTGGNQIHEMGQYVGAAVPTVDGKRLVVALQNSIVLFDPTTGNQEMLCEPEPGNMVNRFNDGKCDPAGRFWIGSTQINHKDPTGVLYCVDPPNQYRSKLDNLLISNGMAWSLDQKSMYFIDSPTLRVQEFDYDLHTGNIGYRKDALVFEQEDGVPDGMCIDATGNLWIAFYGKGKVACYDPRTGTKQHQVSVPAKNTTSCCFGGPDLDVLFITSAKRDDPNGGGLYFCRPGVSGLPADFFGQKSN